MGSSLPRASQVHRGILPVHGEERATRVETPSTFTSSAPGEVRRGSSADNVQRVRDSCGNRQLCAPRCASRRSCGARLRSVRVAAHGCEVSAAAVSSLVVRRSCRGWSTAVWRTPVATGTTPPNPQRVSRRSSVPATVADPLPDSAHVESNM